MTTFDFLVHLRKSGVDIWVEGERLRCSGPEEVLTTSMRQQLAERKAAILAFLHPLQQTSGRRSSLIPIHPEGSAPPVFGVPGHSGDVFGFLDLARRLGTEQPLFALQPPGLEPDDTPLSTVEELAAMFIKDIRSVFSEGPYLLAGVCLGGVIAYEMAQQLTAEGHQVGLVAMFGAGCPTACEPWNRRRAAFYRSIRRVVRHGSAILTRAPQNWAQYVRERADERRRDQERIESNPLRVRLGEALNKAVDAYRPRSADFPVCMMLPKDDPEFMTTERPLDWRRFAKNFNVVWAPPKCNTHMAMVEPHVAKFAQALNERCREVAKSHPGPTESFGALSNPSHSSLNP